MLEKNNIVLIIEDDPGTIILLADKVEDSGYEAVRVKSATEALEWLDKETPYMMILDFMLPEMNGQEFIDELLLTGKPLPPFIVSTGEGDERTAVAMLKLGARDYVIKDGNYLDMIPVILEKVGKEIENEHKLRATEQALAEMNHFNKQIIENAQEGIVVCDVGLRFQLWNPFMEKITGIPASEVIDKNSWDAFPFLIDAFVIEDMKKALNGEIIKGIDFFFKNPISGKTGWVSSITAPFYSNASEIAGTITTISNISDRMQAQIELKESEERFRAVAKSANDAIITSNNNQKILDWNKGAEKIFGYTEEEITGKDLNIIMPSNLQEQHITAIKRMNNEESSNGLGKTIELLALHKNGNEFPVELSLANWETTTGKFYTGIIRDISERKQIEQNLRTLNQRFKLALEAGNFGVWEFDIKQNNLIWDDRMFALYGISRTDFTGNPEIWLQRVHPDDVEQTQIEIQWALDGNKDYDTEFRIVLPNGAERYIRAFGYAIRDETGNPLILSGINFDITDIKTREAEIINSRKELKNFASHLQTAREEERLMLANEIHDELGQILIAMKFDMGMLKQIVQREIENNISEEIMVKVDHLFTLVNKTINTSRRIMTNLRPEILDMLGFIEAAKTLISEFQETYKINCHFQTVITKLNLNSQQLIALYRILQEAITNIAKHAKGATEVIIDLKVIEDKLMMQIIDNGIGIDNKRKVKSDSYGLLGMRERASLLEGELQISNHDGKGTSVKIELPYTN